MARICAARGAAGCTRVTGIRSGKRQGEGKVSFAAHRLRHRRRGRVRLDRGHRGDRSQARAGHFDGDGRLGLRLEPRRGPERPEPARPEGLGRRRPGGRLPRWSRSPISTAAATCAVAGPRSSARPAIRRTRRRTRSTTRAAGRVRAGHGLLLGHRVAEVHPEPRLRHGPIPAGQHGAAASADQPVGRWTTRSRPRTRTRSGSARAASTTPRTARSSSTSTGTRSTSRRTSTSAARGGGDQRGLRRLLGGHDTEVVRAEPRPAAARPTRPASPTGTRPRTTRRRRTACGASTGTCTTPRTSSARSTRTAGSGRVRSGTSGTRSAHVRSPTPSSSRASSTSRARRWRSSPAGPSRLRSASTARRRRTRCARSSSRAGS